MYVECVNCTLTTVSDQCRPDNVLTVNDKTSSVPHSGLFDFNGLKILGTHA